MSKTWCNKMETEFREAWSLEAEANLLKYREMVISFGPEDHPSTVLSNRNVSFIVKVPIGKFNVTKTLSTTVHP